MGKFSRVIVFEVEEAKDKNPETPGGKYRRDTPWLVEAFKRKGVESEILFITGKDTAASLKVGLHVVEEITCRFLLIDEAIASRAVFVIVSGLDGRMEALLKSAK